MCVITPLTSVSLTDPLHSNRISISHECCFYIIGYRFDFDFAFNFPEPPSFEPSSPLWISVCLRCFPLGVYLPQLRELFIKTLSISVIHSRIHFTLFYTRFVWLWPLSLVPLTTANCGKCLLAQFSRHSIRFGPCITLLV